MIKANLFLLKHRPIEPKAEGWRRVGDTVFCVAQNCIVIWMPKGWHGNKLNPPPQVIKK